MEECGKADQEFDPWLQGMQRPNAQSKEQKIIINFTQNLCVTVCYTIFVGSFL